jgi:hypothetical protein
MSFPRLLLSAILFTGPLFGQGPTASITGQVKDPSGAFVAGARVSARNTATNVEHSAPTDSAGLFLIPGLQPGPFEVSAEADGFKREVRAGVTLQVDQEARIDFTLEIGNVSEAVTVTEAAPVTATESASTGQVIENRKVVELPLNSREFYGLALLAPGAYQPAQNSTLGFRGGFNVAGSSETANNFSVNGIDNNDTGINGPSFRPVGRLDSGIQAVDRHLSRRIWAQLRQPGSGCYQVGRQPVSRRAIRVSAQSET